MISVAYSFSLTIFRYFEFHLQKPKLVNKAYDTFQRLVTQPLH